VRNSCHAAFQTKMAAESRFNIRLLANFLLGLSLVTRSIRPNRSYDCRIQTSNEFTSKKLAAFTGSTCAAESAGPQALPILPRSDADDDFRRRALCCAALWQSELSKTLRGATERPFRLSSINWTGAPMVLQCDEGAPRRPHLSKPLWYAALCLIRPAVSVCRPNEKPRSELPGPSEK
jgi:hypothetical protein